MRISFAPQRRNDTMTLSRQGEVLTINGEDFDFSVIPDGATLPSEGISCAFISGDVERVEGELQLCLILPHGPNPTQEQKFPPVILNPADGSIALPGGTQ